MRNRVILVICFALLIVAITVFTQRHMTTEQRMAKPVSPTRESVPTQLAGDEPEMPTTSPSPVMQEVGLNEGFPAETPDGSNEAETEESSTELSEDAIASAEAGEEAAAQELITEGLVLLRGHVLLPPFVVERGSDRIVTINGQPILELAAPVLDPNSHEPYPDYPGTADTGTVLSDVLEAVEAWASEENAKVEDIYVDGEALAREYEEVSSVERFDNALIIHFKNGSEFGVEMPKSDDPGDPYFGTPAPPRDMAGGSAGPDEDIVRITEALVQKCLLIITNEAGMSVITPRNRMEYLVKINSACKRLDRNRAMDELKELLMLGPDNDADAQSIIDNFTMPQI